jgi:hypothetical protein
MAINESQISIWTRKIAAPVTIRAPIIALLERGELLSATSSPDIVSIEYWVKITVEVNNAQASGHDHARIKAALEPSNMI